LLPTVASLYPTSLESGLYAVPCKAFVATKSAGITNYIPDNYDALEVAAFDVDNWVIEESAIPIDSLLNLKLRGAGER
jgi:hypothetical protein